MLQRWEMKTRLLFLMIRHETMSISLIKKRFYKPESRESNTRGYHHAIRAAKFFAPVVTHFRVSSLFFRFQINHYCPLGCITPTFLSFYNSHVTNKDCWWIFVEQTLWRWGLSTIHAPLCKATILMAGVLVRQARSQKGSTSSLCTGIQQVRWCNDFITWWHRLHDRLYHHPLGKPIDYGKTLL